MAYKVESHRTTGKYEVFYDTGYYSVTESTKYVTTYLPIYNTGISSGSFTPGVYRVTPLTKGDGSAKAGESESVTDSFYLEPYLYKGTVTGSLVGPSINYALRAAFPNVDGAIQMALQKATSKVSEADLELGESIGEYRETIQMLRSPLSSLRKFLVDDRLRNLRLLMALAKGNRRQVNRLLGRTGLASAKSMSDTWLELRYGLRPLVMLVQDAIEKVNGAGNFVWDPNKIRSAKSNYEYTTRKKSSFSITPYSIDIRGKIRTIDTVKVFASVQYRQGRESTLLDQLGLTPRYLPELAWELTRLSFVVDWIFTIGPWLGSLRVAPEIEVLGNTVGVKIERQVNIVEAEKRVAHYLAPWKPHSMFGNGSYDRYDRYCQIQLDYLPHFTWARTIDLFRAIDSVALIWQLVAKRRK